jgi:sugar lactone lactonase YvrE
MYRSSQVVTGRMKKSIRIAITFASLLVILATGLTAGAQTIPIATVSSTQTLLNINGNSGHVAVNSVGDLFYVSQTDNIAYELTPGSTKPISIVTGLSGGRSVYVDSSNNLFVPSNYSGRVIEVPYINGGYASGIANSSSIPTCSGAVVAPCVPFGSGGSGTGYYLQTTDMGEDAKGDVFLAIEREGAGYCDQSTSTIATTCNAILEFPAPVTAAVLPVIIAGGPNGNLPQTNSAQIAVDATGDVFYVDNINLYEVKAGTTGAVVISAGLTTPGGVGIDSFGNLYVTDTGNNRIIEMPELKGVPQPASAFVLSYTYSANGVAIDPEGRLIYTGYANSSTNLEILTPWSANLGSFPVGTASAPLTLTVTFTGAVTPAKIGLTGVTNSAFAYTGGTCAAGTAYTLDSNCTITVTYTPNAVGQQTGAVELSTSTGANILTAYLSGTGLGAAQTVDPGAATNIAATWKTPGGIALDPAGNLYVADAAANTVYRYVAGTTTAPTTVGAGLSGPTAVATDGAGDVFIADSGNGRVVEVPLQNGALVNSAQAVIYPATGGTATKGATGLFIDYTGSLYIADSGNATVLRLVNIGGTPSTNYVTTLGSGFMAPLAVVANNSNSVFIADELGNAVYELTIGTAGQLAIGSSLSHPSGLALDPAGSLYIADSGNQRLIKIPYSAGAFNANNQFAIAQSVVTPYGVALDPLGNVYVSDSVDATVTEVTRTQGLLNLGEANVGTISSQVLSQISDSGNQSLIFQSPLYTQTGSASSFTITPPSSGGCVAAATLLSGADCTLAVTFNPATDGNLTSTLVFTDNAANTATPSLQLAGLGTSLPTSQTSLALSVTSPVIGQPLTVTATITSSTAGTIGGTVQFLLDGANNGHPQTVTNGTATITFTGLTGGTHSVGASYSGSSTFASSAAKTLTFTVVAAPSTTTLTVSSGTNSNPQSENPGYPSVLVATVVQQSGVPVPTGTVTFYNGSTSGTVLGGPVTVAALGTSGYGATATTAPLAAGTYNIIAVYSGDPNNLSSTSPPVPLIITVPNFILTPTNQNFTVIGTQGDIHLTASVLGGLTGGVGIVCTGMPTYSSCSLNPNDFSIPCTTAVAAIPCVGNSIPVDMYVYLNQVPKIPPPPVGELHFPGMSQGVSISLACFLLAPFGFYGRRKRRRFRKGMNLMTFLLVLFIGVASLSLTSCSSGFFGATPAGTYNITVTATLSQSSGPNYVSTATVAMTVK